MDEARILEGQTHRHTSGHNSMTLKIMKKKNMYNDTLLNQTTNQIKGLSEYKPIELKTFVSKTLIAQVERQVNATKKNKNKPTTHVQSIFEMKSLSLV